MPIDHTFTPDERNDLLTAIALGEMAQDRVATIFDSGRAIDSKEAFTFDPYSMLGRRIIAGDYDNLPR